MHGPGSDDQTRRVFEGGWNVPRSTLLDHIGNTPLVELRRLSPTSGVSILGKLELFNPTGSIKDRTALRMIEGAEQRGELTAGMTVIEATSGNTGISLGMVCALKGYRCNFFMSESKSLERRLMLHYLGCDVTLTSSDDPDSSIWAAKEMAEQEAEGIFYINQNENPDNVLAHREGTGQEIVADLGGEVDAVVAGFGTGGTLMGISEAFQEAGVAARIVSVEPTSSKSVIEGITQSEEGYIPTIYDAARVDEIIQVADQDALATTRLLAEKEGISAGISSGATVWAAMQLARRMERGNIVAIIADSAARYFSTPLFEGAREASG